ncbi:MAG: hypothetical protein ABJA98_20750 [Acidobacteriota bacterium]
MLLAGFVGAGVVGYVATRFTSNRTETLSDGVRYVGTVLQMLGLYVVLRAINGAQKLFNRPTLGASFRDWSRRLRSAFRPSRHVLQAITGVGAVSVTGNPSAVLIQAPRTIEDRVRVLEQGLASLRSDLDLKISTVTTAISKVEASVTRESDERSKALNALTATIDSFAVDDLHLEMVAAVWLFFGIIGTSIPQEAARLIAWIVR